MSRKGQQPIVLNPEAQQEQLLKEAKHMVDVQAFQMKRALDQNNIMDALKHASNMISELRTGLLTPRSYYALYVLTSQHLRHLEMYIGDLAHGRPLHELYELVQYAGNILPRLYLLVTIGSVYIKSMLVPAKEVLYDLVELCRGVQHPTRGLFLRNYLSEMTKDKLPDDGSKYEGTVNDSIDFVIANFTEMNKLWVRLQHLGTETEKKKREQEREELNILVGKNLSRLSQLDGLTIGLYKSDVLPRITQQIISCKDKIAQQYLMVILIQAFPDDFHLRTLDQLLEGVSKVIEDVDVQPIITSLINRLATYCEAHPETRPSDINMFEVFSKYIQNMSSERKSMSLPTIIGLGTSLINLAVRCYKEQYMEYIDQVFDFTGTTMTERGFTTPTAEAVKETLNLLQSVPTHFKSVRPALQLKNYSKVLDLLPPKDKRTLALYLVENALVNETDISVTDEAATLLAYLAPLAKRDKDITDDDEWSDDQTKVSYIINRFNSSDVNTLFGIIMKSQEFFSASGNVHVKYTLVPLLFKALYCIQVLLKNKETDQNWEKKAKAIFKFTNDAATAVKDAGEHLLAFNIYLQCTLAAARANLSNFAYSFLTKGALAIFEDEKMTASKTEYDALRLLIGTVGEVTCFSKDEHEIVAKKLVQYSGKMVHLEHQCRATTYCAYLFYSKISGEEFQDPKLALACLKKAMTVAQSETDPAHKTALLVELLDHYVNFYERRPEVVEVIYINTITQKIKKQFSSGTAGSAATAAHYKNVRDYVEKKQAGSPDAARWAEIKFDQEE